jgi:hypothetical protein
MEHPKERVRRKNFEGLPVKRSFRFILPWSEFYRRNLKKTREEIAKSLGLPEDTSWDEMRSLYEEKSKK